MTQHSIKQQVRRLPRTYRRAGERLIAALKKSEALHNAEWRRRRHFEVFGVPLQEAEADSTQPAPTDGGPL